MIRHQITPNTGYSTSRRIANAGSLARMSRESRSIEPVRASFGQVAAGMDRGVGHELDRIVPAEIFEVDEAQLAVWTAQRVVQSEIGRAQRAMGKRKRRARIPAQAPRSADRRRRIAAAPLGTSCLSRNARKSGCSSGERRNLSSRCCTAPRPPRAKKCWRRRYANPARLRRREPLQLDQEIRELIGIVALAVAAPPAHHRTIDTARSSPASLAIGCGVDLMPCRARNDSASYSCPRRSRPSMNAADSISGRGTFPRPCRDETPGCCRRAEPGRPQHRPSGQAAADGDRFLRADVRSRSCSEYLAPDISPSRDRLAVRAGTRIAGEQDRLSTPSGNAVVRRRRRDRR